MCGLFHFQDMKNEIIIWATREGRRKPFPSGLWARMPAHKWGWVEEMPERPKALFQPPPKAGEDAMSNPLGVLDFVNEDKEKPEKPKAPAKKKRKIEK